MTNPQQVRVSPADLTAMAGTLDEAATWVRDTAARMGDHWAPQAWGYLLGQVFGGVAHIAMDSLEQSCAQRSAKLRHDADELRAIVARYVGTDLDAADSFTTA
ncbi:hypothetical protein [Actinokineospora sp. NBRC 105648]|uniref:hypothetical protein n=1 Tax=Actinokineospora sp. NBRC 105648 TaxID=3032206 RepID=UPI0024A29F93|nr:hypothetical protein [Actinokineospora sp. NBRC 105648]GLZ38693.1 hypothetical protein Acsp05_23170 [Actinokineospora sp. NBRC 105648]